MQLLYTGTVSKHMTGSHVAGNEPQYVEPRKKQFNPDPNANKPTVGLDFSVATNPPVINPVVPVALY